MKVAIVCDWLVTLGGAEKVLSEMLKCYPAADLFALIDFFPGQYRSFIQHKNVKTTFLQHFPLAKKHYRKLLPLMPLAIEQLDLSAYDLIISSSHAVAKGVITRPDQLHVSYVHSPMRYAWDLQWQYLKETGLDRRWSGVLARYFLHRLRLWDVASANRVDHFLANSDFIGKRIFKTYRRQAKTLYPPVDVSRFVPGKKKEAFYVTASRLVPYKRVDLIVESFATMPDKQLIVIGDGPEFEKIKRKASANITLLGHQPDDILIDHLQRAQAFIFAALEDFGILPLESQACGTPVIAYGQGGALETVLGPKTATPTGLFFDQQTVASLCAAVKEFEVNSNNYSIKHCVENAARFSPLVFRQALKAAVDGCFELN